MPAHNHLTIESSATDRSFIAYRRLSLAVMVLLLLLAAIFWRERAWLLDVAYQTVLMLREGRVQVQVYRFGAAVVQAPPLLAMKLGLPLWAISLCYSLAFPLVYLLFWWLTVRVLRQPLLGLGLALLYTGMAYDGFYWCTSELQQGLGFLLVTWAFILRFPALDRGGHWALLVPALVALAFYHPLVFIPYFFCWAYFAPGRWRGSYIALAAILVAILWAKGQWAPNWYDSSKMTLFRDNLARYFPNYFSFPAYAKFLRHCLLYWWGFPLLLVVNTAWFLHRKRWWPLLLTWGFSLGFLVLNAIGSPDPAHRFYSEVNYWPLLIFVIVPFVWEIVPAFAPRRWFWWLLALFFAGRLLLIGLHHRPYTARVHWLHQQLQQAPAGDRFLLPESRAPMDTLLMSWGTPFESLLLTAAKHPDSAKTLLVTPEPQRYAHDLLQSDSLLNTFRPLPLNHWAYPYVNLSEDGHYIPLQ